MKKIFFGLYLSCCIAGLQAQDNEVKVPFDTIANAIAAGDADAIATYFSNTMECVLLNEEGTYSKVQAMLAFKNFLKKHPPKSFSFKHSSTKQVIKYAVGIMQTQNGNALRVTVFLKQENGIMKIRQLRIESEE